MAKDKNSNAKTLMEYPEQDSKPPIFTVSELKNNRIKVVYEPEGYHFEGTGDDLGKALDKLLIELNKMGQQAYQRYHRKIFDEFLSELVRKDFRI